MPDVSLTAHALPAIVAGTVFGLLALVALEARAAGTISRRVARTVVRAAILLLVALALAEPTLARERPAPRRLVVLVDRAAADVAGGRAARDALLTAARTAAARSGSTLDVLGFDALGARDLGDDATPDGPEGAPGRAARSPARSRLAPALAAAALRVDAAETAAVVVASDGRADATGADAGTQGLVARGIPVRAVAIPSPAAPSRPAPELDALDVPDLAASPFAVRASVSDAPSGLTARLLVDGAPSATHGPLPLAPDGTVSFDGIVLPPGLHDVAVRVDDGSDARPGPRAEAPPTRTLLRRALVRVAKPPRVLLIGAGPTGAVIRQRLSAQGFEVSLVRAEDAGEALVAADGVDLVVLDADAVSAERPKERYLAVLAERVRAGKGLVVAAGASAESWAALALGPLGGLLPLVPEEPRRAPIPPAPPPPQRPPDPTPPAPDDAPETGPGLVADVRPELALPISLLLVIDRSGSMQEEGKLGMAIRAAEEAARSLADSDRVGVISFSDDARVDTPMTSVALASATGLVPPLLADGNTDIFAALALAARTMAAESSSIRHVLLLTDGMQTGSAYFTDLLRGMADERITVSTVGLGQSIQEYRLKAIARQGNGRYFFASTPQDLPRVLTRDTRAVVEHRAAEAKRARMNDPARAPAPKPPEPRETPAPPPAPPPSSSPPPPPPPDRAGPGVERLERRRTHESVLGIDEARLPSVGPALATTAPSPTSIVLARAGGAPVLGVDRHGLGRIVVLALPVTDPGFLAWPDATAFLAQAARAVTPPSEEGPLVEVRVVSGVEGDRLRVAVPEGVDPSALAARIRVRRRGADGDVDAPATRTDGGDVEWRLPPTEGSFASAIVVTTAEDGSDARTLPPIAYVPSAGARAPTGSDPRALASALSPTASEAAATDPTDPALFDVPPRSRPERTPLAPLLAGLAALLLPIDVALHRRGKDPR